MAKRITNKHRITLNQKKQVTSDGQSKNSRPKNKHRRRNFKRRIGQGK